MAQALIQSREGTIDPEQATATIPGIPQVCVPDIGRWEGWVRTFLGLYELLEPLHFVVPELPSQEEGEDPNGFKKRVVDTQDERTMSLWCMDGLGAPPPEPADSNPKSADSAQGRVDVKGVVQIRRPPQATFEAQISQVLDWAELRNERAGEILAQINNQYPFWGLVVPLHNGRMAKTVELVELVTQFAVFVESRFKHELNCWRPADISAQVQPMLTTPGHGSFPSGHCTQSYAIAHVIASLLATDKPLEEHDARRVQLQRLAARVSTNRVIAGVHFPVDNLVGRLLGETLGEYFVARCIPANEAWIPRFFDGSKEALDPDEKFTPSKQKLDPKSLDEAAFGCYRSFDKLPPTMYSRPSAILKAMWEAARAECSYLRPA